ncbi:hypothetical protein F5I97DRAFT_1809023 [Phlebopus sp. FC_14]|nr:hypothetical protein F5I97DRAFT_1809023 [Phlebopus sp. FC_14]
MHPSYSPLFTLGLLAEHCIPASPQNPRPSTDDASAFYFTLHTSARDTVELRSFLYLDLAEYNRPGASHRRKPSTVSKSTSWTCTTDVNSIYDLRTERPPVFTPAPPLPVSPVSTLRRSSKESLRNIPLPKPAPSTTLPDPPVVPASRSPTSPNLPSMHRTSHSAPVIPSTLLSPTSISRRQPSLRSESITSSARRNSRMDALACLEGRTRTAHHCVSRPNTRRNFMNLSDDDEDDQISKVSSAPLPTPPQIQVEDVEDEADAIMPSLSPKYKSRKVAHHRRASSRPTTRKRSRTMDSCWFPLKSFIDFKDDDLSSWNWRSFIEIGGVA